MGVENLSEGNGKNDASFIKIMFCDKVRIRTFIFQKFVAVTKNKYVTQSCRTGTQCHLRSALLSYITLLSRLNVKHLAFLIPETFLIIPLFKYLYFEYL